MATTIQSGKVLSPRALLFWRTAQGLVWLTGLGILLCLFFRPSLGLDLFWNLLIPLAPALLVLALGAWRNLCPMAVNSLLPRHLGISKRKKLSRTQSGRLNLIGVIALFVLVPLRHAFFDLNGPATGYLILGLAAVALTTGFFFEWKSVWCAGLCPVHPVEKLYGQSNRLTLPNAHCGLCHQCVAPCPDSTPGIHPLSVRKHRSQRISGFLMVGAFPGFVWGWFQVPDFSAMTHWTQWLILYLYPLLGMLATALLFVMVQTRVKRESLIAIFSAAAVSCYYWYRLPALFGYGHFAQDGMLLDLRPYLPAWSLTAVTAMVVVFFFWWIVFNPRKKTSWVRRPAFAHRNSKT